MQFRFGFSEFEIWVCETSRLKSGILICYFWSCYFNFCLISKIEYGFPCYYDFAQISEIEFEFAIASIILGI